MSDVRNPVTQLLREDPRYQLEAYQFVREALTYAQEKISGRQAAQRGDPQGESDVFSATEEERHLTGQQLCEAIRRYALEQFGYMAQVVLRNWGVTTTSDFGEIVYNLIRIGFMKKSDSDRREDFNDVYNFDQAFREQFQMTRPE